MGKTFGATTCAETPEKALEYVRDLLASKAVAGFEVTGRVQVRSERHLMWVVEVADLGGDRNDCWVVLTSYGVSPDETLGSAWEAVLG